MAYNEHGYGTTHMSNAYSHNDLMEMWCVAGVASDRLIELAKKLERKEGSLYPFILKRAGELHWLAEAAHEAMDKQDAKLWA